MEFIQGLELFEVIRTEGILPLEQTRFYSAILVNAFESIHLKKIIYRDLKPENVMVCADGYLKLIDMGTCKLMKEKTTTSLNSGKSFTIIGTPNYMAPEIISGKGYSYSADLWALGVLIFELLVGYVPFGSD